MKYIKVDDLIQFCTEKLIVADDDVIIQAHNNAFRCMRDYIKSSNSADVVDFVRCKDCEFWNTERESGLKGWCYCEVYKGYKEAEGFCNCGEQRESE